MTYVTGDYIEKQIKRNKSLEKLGFHEPFNPFPPIPNLSVCPGNNLPPIDESCYVDITEDVKYIKE